MSLFNLISEWTLQCDKLDTSLDFLKTFNKYFKSKFTIGFPSWLPYTCQIYIFWITYNYFLLLFIINLFITNKLNN